MLLQFFRFIKEILVSLFQNSIQGQLSPLNIHLLLADPHLLNTEVIDFPEEPIVRLLHVKLFFQDLDQLIYGLFVILFMFIVYTVHF